MSADPQEASEARRATLVHDLANPLSAVLAEVQLLLLDGDDLPAGAVESLRTIEAAALRMRVILRNSGGNRTG